jgi:ABC-type phosphate transport system substrate-binding protein
MNSNAPNQSIIFKSGRSRKPILLSLLILVLSCIITTDNYGNNDLSGIAVIVNAHNPTNALSKSEVKLIYLRRISKRWKGINKNIVPIDRKENTNIRSVFLDKIIGMSDEEMSRYFTEREYMYAESPPLEVNSDAEVIAYVSRNIGAIGYVDASSVTPELLKQIKVVFP